MTRAVDPDLAGVIARGEGATVEFKRSLAARPFWSASPILARSPVWRTTTGCSHAC